MASYTRDAADLLAVSATLSWRYGCGRPITSGAHQCEDAFEPDAVAARLDFPAIVLPPVERTSEVGRDGGYRNRTAVLVYFFQRVSPIPSDTAMAKLMALTNLQ